MRFIKTVINYGRCECKGRAFSWRKGERERRNEKIYCTFIHWWTLHWYFMHSNRFFSLVDIQSSWVPQVFVCSFIHSFARFDRIFRFLHKTTDKTQENEKYQTGIFLPFCSSVFSFFFFNCHSITNIYNKSNVENLMCTLEVWSVLARWVLEWRWFDWKYRWMCRSRTVPLHSPSVSQHGIMRYGICSVHRRHMRLISGLMQLKSPLALHWDLLKQKN